MLSPKLPVSSTIFWGIDEKHLEYLFSIQTTPFCFPANVIPHSLASYGKLHLCVSLSFFLSLSFRVASSFWSAADHSGQRVCAAPLERERWRSPWLLGDMGGARTYPTLHSVLTTQPPVHHPQPRAQKRPGLCVTGVPDSSWRGNLLHCLGSGEMSVCKTVMGFVVVTQNGS